ncbi:helix-turn-helix domain-containing protein [Agrobacterium vitis]|uniref:helix-turn-helix domain-containing protein n=1 Tax=Agrobacterium vitis TaxID=373 RepID=UPI003D2A144A
MIFLPISFFVALLLLTLLIRMLRQDDAPASAKLFLLLLAVMAVQSVLVGLRWGYGMMLVMPAMSALATVIPPLSFLAFRSLTSSRADRQDRGFSQLDWLYAVPTAIVLVLSIAGGGPIDAIIILTFLAYGLALLWLARLGPDGLTASRLDGALRSYRALQCMAASLLASAVTDIVISLDFAFGGGRHAATVVSAFMTLILLALGFAASLAESGASSDENGREEQKGENAGDKPVPRSASEEDAQIASALAAMMVEKQLYKDVDLNLGRLARRLGLPARSVSNAVNRVHSMSVSQYVNNQRVSEACRLLRESDEPITSIVFEAGFMTKSNFNREFLRVTGQSPSAWRRQETIAQACA